MRIRCKNPGTRRIFNREYMKIPVEFDESGLADVPKSVGEALIEHFPGVMVKVAAKKKPASTQKGKE